MAMVTVTTLKQYLPEITGNNANTDLEALLDRVESATARYMGWRKPDNLASPRMLASTHTFYLDGPTYENPQVLQLPMRPVQSITSIHVDIDRQYGNETLMDAGDYELDKYEGRVILKPIEATDVFERGYRAIKVICEAGFANSYLPADLEHGICVWASQLHRNKATQGKDSITQRAATISISPKNMPPEVKEILAPFRESRQIL
jgi:uncharacterized phiE125 gp8 family phage protein